MKRATGRKRVYYDKHKISIHALVKRATEVLCKTSAKLNISIHALVKRATTCYLHSLTYSIFQSTPS